MDYPINPMKQAISAGATFVARTTHTNPNHVLQMMEAAMDHDGFSFIECLSECVEFFPGAFDASNPRKGVKFDEVPKEHDVTDEFAAYRLADEALTESDDGILRGSARSIEGLHITDAISSQKDSLLNFGGHPMAAGLSLPKENLSSFRRGLGKAIEKQLGEIVREEPTLQIDSWLGLDEINLDLADSIEMLAPFGAGNPKLKFASRGVTLKSVAEIGKTKEHLRLAVEDENGNVQSILWWGGAGEELPETGSQVDVAYSVRASTFRGENKSTRRLRSFALLKIKPLRFESRD